MALKTMTSNDETLQSDDSSTLHHLHNDELEHYKPSKINTKSTSTPSSSKRQSFVITDSILAEIWLQLKIAIPIAIGNVTQILPQIINNIFIGHLPNSVLLLSAVNLARTFSNVTATSIAWGFSSALYTLIPNAIGARNHHLLRIYIQRALYIDLALFIPLTILQCFAGEIMQSINEPSELISVISVYCRWLLPFVYFNTFNTAIKRIAQSVNYNFELLLIQIVCGLLAYPLNLLFVHYLQFGYLGTAITLNVCTLLQFTSTLVLTLRIERCKYIDIFYPLPLKQVLNTDGLREYLSLSLPGLAQYSLEWWMIEICIVLCGYIQRPDLALGSSAIVANLVILIIMIALGNAASITYRVGKYMGTGDVNMLQKAKTSAKCGLGIGLVVSVIVFFNLYYFRCQIGFIWTNDTQINEMICEGGLISVVIAQQFAISLYQNLGGIYRGVGYQKISAVCVIFSYYCIAIPLMMLLLFGLRFSEWTMESLLVIWSSLAMGNAVAAVMLCVHLVFYLDWNVALQRTKQRTADKNKAKLKPDDEKHRLIEAEQEQQSKLNKNNSSYGSTANRHQN